MVPIWPVCFVDRDLGPQIFIIYSIRNARVGTLLNKIVTKNEHIWHVLRPVFRHNVLETYHKHSHFSAGLVLSQIWHNCFKQIKRSVYLCRIEDMYIKRAASTAMILKRKTDLGHNLKLHGLQFFYLQLLA